MAPMMMVILELTRAGTVVEQIALRGDGNYDGHGSGSDAGDDDDVDGDDHSDTRGGTDSGDVAHTASLNHLLSSVILSGSSSSGQVGGGSKQQQHALHHVRGTDDGGKVLMYRIKRESCSTHIHGYRDTLQH